MKKLLLVIGITMVMSSTFTLTSFAGSWQQDSVGWWYQNDDNTFPSNQWEWIDSNNDGTSECYYFNQDGYLLTDTEIDGYTVNSDGVWVVNNVVQVKEQNKQKPQFAYNTDEKSGLTKYRDESIGKYGFVGRQGNVVIPARWANVDDFYAGYTIGYVDYDGIFNDDYSANTCTFEIINEAGQIVGTFNWTISGGKGDAIGKYASQNLDMFRFVENNDNLFGYTWVRTRSKTSYFTFDINGTVTRKDYPDIAPTLVGNTLTFYDLAAFRNGSANVYKIVKPYLIQNVFEEGTTTGKVIGSITTDGEFSTYINPESKYTLSDYDKERKPPYGTKQFAE